MYFCCMRGSFPPCLKERCKKLYRPHHLDQLLMVENIVEECEEDFSEVLEGELKKSHKEGIDIT